MKADHNFFQSVFIIKAWSSWIPGGQSFSPTRLDLVLSPQQVFLCQVSLHVHVWGCFFTLLFRFVSCHQQRSVFPGLGLLYRSRVLLWLNGSFKKYIVFSLSRILCLSASTRSLISFPLCRMTSVSQLSQSDRPADLNILVQPIRTSKCVVVQMLMRSGAEVSLNAPVERFSQVLRCLSLKRRVRFYAAVCWGVALHAVFPV